MTKVVKNSSNFCAGLNGKRWITSRSVTKAVDRNRKHTNDTRRAETVPGQLFQKQRTEKADRIFLNNLNTESNKRVFLLPSLTDFERYISTNDAIIIRLLISESPLQLVEGISTPTIEKVLVDIVGDVEFSFLQGSEINHVYTTIIERHNVNKNKLLRYATRRGRKEEVEQLINANKL